jgi:DNA repair exonuclease SbcCD ATPase subunit
MQLTTKNFRWAPNGSRDWKSIYVSWTNGSWKSTMLYAVEWCLFGTIQGKIKWTTPYKHNTDFVSVEVAFGDKKFSRQDKNTWSYIDTKYRPIMFCNLLDQENADAKRIIADIVIRDEARDLLGRFWLWNIEESVKKIRADYNVYKKTFESKKSQIDVYQKELNDMQEVWDDIIKEWASEIENIKVEIMTLENVFDKSKLEEYWASVENYRKLLTELESDYNNKIQKKVQILEKMEEVKQEWLTANWWSCYACWQELNDIKERVLKSLRSKYAELGWEKWVLDVEIDELSARIEKTKIELKSVEVKYEEFKKLDQSEKLRALEKKYYEWKEKLIKCEWIKDLRKDYEEKIDKLVIEITETSDQELIDAYNAISPSGKLNQILNSKITNLIDWFEIIIAEENKITGEFKSVFNVKTEQDGVEVAYVNLSRSQKFMANLLLSSRLLEMDWKNLPLLIDDFEMFDKEHAKKLLSKIKADKILTKVSDKEFEISVKNK